MYIVYRHASTASTASSLLIFFAKLLQEKTKHASRDKRGRRKPEKKKLETADSFVKSGDNEAVKVI